MLLIREKLFLKSWVAIKGMVKGVPARCGHKMVQKLSPR